MNNVEQEARAEAEKSWPYGHSDQRVRDIREGARIGFICGVDWLASRPASPAPWDEGGCFGHCDPEGWARCRKPASPATREAVARIISDAENQTDAEGSWALPEDVADALLAAFTITERAD